MEIVTVLLSVIMIITMLALIGGSVVVRSILKLLWRLITAPFRLIRRIVKG